MSDNKLVISDEAVEAAAKAIREAIHPTQASIVGPYAASEAQAYAALEAAAPYMLAAEPGSAMREAMYLAWEQGYHAHMSDGYEYQTANPYRSQA